MSTIDLSSCWCVFKVQKQALKKNCKICVFKIASGHPPSALRHNNIYLLLQQNTPTTVLNIKEKICHFFMILNGKMRLSQTILKSEKVNVNFYNLE